MLRTGDTRSLSRRALLVRRSRLVRRAQRTGVVGLSGVPWQSLPGGN
ncbi:hypothetical protein [Paenibacillus jilunlii]|nr:hypothetical protein [Paenibacillus jilunlii]